MASLACFGFPPHDSPQLQHRDLFGTCLDRLLTLGQANVEVLSQRPLVLDPLLLDSYVPAVKSLGQSIVPIDAELGNQIIEYAGVADRYFIKIIKIGNDYVAAPSGSGYQAFLNAVDAFAANIDTQVVAATHIKNPQTTPTLIVPCGSTSGPLVKCRQLGFEQRMPTRFASMSLVFRLKSSRYIFLRWGQF